MTRVDEALRRARQRIAAVDAGILLAHRLGRSRAWLAARPEFELEAPAAADFAALVARRAAGEPVAYLTGGREFYGRLFSVSAAVLIPRPETELLVDLLLAHFAGGGAGEARLLDLGSGSGCIAVTLALELARARVTAADLSAEALELVRHNASAHGARLETVVSDWYSALAGRRFEAIVANPPYVAAGDPRLGEGDLRYEPELALIGGADGLLALRQIVAAAPAHLTPGGQLLLEHGYDQAEAVARLLAAAGFVGIEQHRDLAGIVRVSAGRWPGGDTDATDATDAEGRA